MVVGSGVTTSSNNPVNIVSVILEEQNKPRRKAGLADLSLCPLMVAKAEEHAQLLATSTSDKMEVESSTDEKYWSNVSTSGKKEKVDAIKDAVGKLQGKHSALFLHPLVGSMGLGAAQKQSGDGWIVVMLYNAPKLCRGFQYR